LVTQCYMPINKRFFHYGACICMNLNIFSDTYFWHTIIPHNPVLYKGINLTFEWGMRISSNIPDEATVKTLINITQYSNSLKTTLSRLSTQWHGIRYTNLQHSLMINPQNYYYLMKQTADLPPPNNPKHNTKNREWIHAVIK
jgi:hypothetical protein